MIFIEDFPELDFSKCLKMALLHDIVEIFAWDTVIFDTKMEATKEEREQKAIIQLEEVLWEESFTPMKEIIEEYMNRSSLEAEFVHQIDKFQPIMQIVMQWWDSWHQYKIDKTKLIEKKYKQIDDKFGIMKILDIYFEKAEKENMFYNEN
jgi:putative hydrolase of HD superfamily